ncbi:hypothetical protein [Senegalimassilia faecalis]|uniref:hypothetical protein n=1 Tax=Senegalimassilia faecalis TaxID=2509433 RepID=UPI0030786E1B
MRSGFFAMFGAMVKRGAVAAFARRDEGSFCRRGWGGLPQPLCRIQERGIVATVGRFFEFLNLRLGCVVAGHGRFLVCELVTWRFAYCCKAIRCGVPMVLRGRFSFGELCPQFIQLLEKVTNSGRFLEKLNVGEGLNKVV